MSRSGATVLWSRLAVFGTLVLVAATMAGSSVGTPSAPARKPTITREPDRGAGPYLKIADFAQWRIYERRYLVKNVDVSGAAAKLTHIEYSFGNVSDGRCVESNEEGAGDAWADYQRPFRADEAVDGIVKSHGLGGVTLWSLDGDDDAASLVSALDVALR